MITWKRKLGFGLPAISCFCLSFGYAADAIFPLKSAEGQVLNTMLNEGRTVTPEPPALFPMAFEPIVILRSDDFCGGSISARTHWKWTLPVEQRDAALRRFAEEPLAENAILQAVVVRLEYLDSAGSILASDELTMGVREDQRGEKLMNFGRGGEPVRIRAVVERVSVAAPVPAIPPAAEEPTPRPVPDAAK